MTPKELRFVASQSSGEVSALLQLPNDARCLLVFAHGAGAGMRHVFMESVCERLVAHGVATFRYQFPYMEQGSRRPSPRPLLLASVRSALAAAREAAPGLPLFASGKSLGGRMTSLAAAAEPLPDVCGVIFFGFPLHAAGKPGSERGKHLAEVGLPMLFLQGTRDSLCDLELLGPVLKDVKPAPTLHVVEGADHGFHVLKRSGRNDDEVLDELAGLAADWATRLL